MLQHVLREHKSKMFLFAAVVMPDHVHLLFRPWVCLPEIMDGIRAASAHSINQLLNRKGKVWERDFFDRLPRDGEFPRYLDYICTNPVKAGLSATDTGYPWLWIESVY